MNAIYSASCLILKSILYCPLTLTSHIPSVPGLTTLIKHMSRIQPPVTTSTLAKEANWSLDSIHVSQSLFLHSSQSNFFKIKVCQFMLALLSNSPISSHLPVSSPGLPRPCMASLCSTFLTSSQSVFLLGQMSSRHTAFAFLKYSCIAPLSNSSYGLLSCQRNSLSRCFNMAHSFL